MTREQKIDKLKAILRGELTIEAAFAPYTVKLWIEVAPGIYAEKGSERRFALEEIKPLQNGANVYIHMFHPNGEPVPELAGSESEVDLSEWKY